MTRAELLEETRQVVGDTLSPYAWSDSRLVAWLSEGQDTFCRLTGFWQDSSTYTLTTVLDQTDYTLPGQIISVKSVWDGNRQLIDGIGKTFSETDFSDSTAQRPLHYRMGKETGKLTLFEPPTAGVVLTLRVHRKSLSPLTRKSSTITLGGTFHAGDTLLVTINSNLFSYTVQAGDINLAGAATSLGAFIAADTAFSVVVSGQSVSIASADAAVSTYTTAQVTGGGATIGVTVSNSYSSDPEIPEEMHNALIEYAAYKAYGDHDRELQDPIKARDHYANFMFYVKRGLSMHRALTGDYPNVLPDPLYVV